MKIYIVFLLLLLATPISAGKSYNLECSCIPGLVAHEEEEGYAKAPVLDSHGKKSCDCYSPTFTNKDAEHHYDGNPTDDFSVKANSHTAVELFCNSTSGSQFGYVVDEPNWSQKGKDLKHCEISQTATSTQPTIFRCNNPTGSMKHFTIESYRCVDYGVLGHWVPVSQLTASSETFVVEMGTAHGESTASTTTETFSTSVSTTASAGIEMEGISGGVETTLSSTMSKEFSQTQAQFWSMDKRTGHTINFGAEDVGKSFWQFQYKVVDPWNKVAYSVTDYTSLTVNESVRPLCLPGLELTGSGGQYCCDTDTGESGYLPPIPNPVPAFDKASCYASETRV